MSALFGLVRFDEQPVELAAVQAMGKAMLDRGSDGQGIWFDSSAGLGCNLLRITPEAMYEKQPVRGASDAIVLVADARVDNRLELINLLELNVHQQLPITDSELILAAYRQWGRSCPRRIVGDFAFVIWEKKSKTLFAARDPMGIRPLYYSRSRRFFAFASEMKSLFSLDEISTHINESHLGRFLLRMVPDAASTFYQDIVRLLPGHTLVLSEEKLVVSPYWSPMDCADIRFSSDREYQEAFKEIFQEAVRCRLRSGYPVGSTLSGGLDSSSITCVARRLLKPSSVPLHTFSAIFPSLDPALLALIDEREYMDAVLAENDLESHMIRADLLGPLAELDELMQVMDAPFFAPNLYIHLAMYRKAQQNNVRVFLDGIDGDTVISYGFERLPQMLLQGMLGGFLREMRGIQTVYNSSKSITNLALDYGLKPLVRPAWSRLRKIGSGTDPMGWQAVFPLNPSFARRINAGDLLIKDSPWLPTISASREHRQALCSPVFPDLLETTGKLASRYGLEDRYPFFDQRLIEFCVGIPPEQKLRSGWSRWILRKSLQGILPEKIRTRPSKAKLSPNFNTNLLKNRQYIERIFSDGLEQLAPYVDLSSLQNQYETFVSSGRNNNTLSLQLFSAACVYSWLQK